MRLQSSLLRLTTLLGAFSLIPALAAQSSLPSASAADRAEAHDIFKQLIEINTTDTPAGNVTTAAAAMQKR